MVVQNLTKRRKVPDTKGMDVTSVEGLVGAKVGLSPEDVLKQRAFYASVRETIISLLLVVVLYLLSYWLVAKYSRHRTREECYAGEEDATVYRVATWLCSFALCISLGSALLLPLSIIGNEVLVHYPDSRYIQWLNTSLIQGLWNQVFLGCNISLFFLLPFAFFFTESAGFAGSRKVMSRVYETVLLVGLLLVMTVVMVAIVTSFIFDQDDQYSLQWWLSYVPLLYSLVSMAGVALMSVCTPLGFSSLFTVLGEVITRPLLHSNVEEEVEVLRFEEAAIQRRNTLQGGVAMGARLSLGEPGSSVLQEGVAMGRAQLALEEEANLEKIKKTRKLLENRLHSSPWERNCMYPLCFLFLVAMTLLAMAMVALNILSLIINPAEQLSVQEYLLGKESTSQLGSVGVVLEAGLIVYFMCASVVGVYSVPPPLQRWLLPTPHDTPMTKIVANCAVLLVLSSALPLLSRTLGITKFNLLGHFSSLEWQRSIWLLLSYNVLFLAITSMILFQRVTRSIVREASWLLGSRLVFRTSRKTAPKRD